MTNVFPLVCNRSRILLGLGGTNLGEIEVGNYGSHLELNST